MQGGKADELKGRVKEAAGSLLDDDDLKREGRVEQAAGEVKVKAEEAVEKAKDMLTGAEKEEENQEE